MLTPKNAKKLSEDGTKPTLVFRFLVTVQYEMYPVNFSGVKQSVYA